MEGVERVKKKQLQSQWLYVAKDIDYDFIRCSDEEKWMWRD